MTSDNLWAGIDVGCERAAVCVTDALGKVLLEQTVDATSQSIAEILQAVPKERLELIGVEAGTSWHLIRTLRALGIPIVVLEARRASKITKVRRDKTDINDARGLADIVCLGGGSVSHVHEKTAESRRIRMQLTLRQQFIKQRVAGEQLIWANLRECGRKSQRVGALVLSVLPSKVR